MAVQILEQGPVCDGYDVQVRLADGRLRRVHFLQQPGNVQSVCDSFETDLLANDALQEIAANLQAVSRLGAIAVITFNFSTVNQNVAMLRVVYPFMREEKACLVSEFLLTLTDVQIKNVFNMTQNQCNAFRIRLQSKADLLSAVKNQVGE